ncbi:MAG TPA: FtsX-like permease family protein, partial [Pyrinomonadaceae bacterium]|nr:FtsX-like permease family protein [Pyrinomonadaceae bacterium]
ARFLLTADVEINSATPFSEAELKAIETVAAANSGIIEARNETIQTTTMSRPSDADKTGSTMLELKGIESNFPLVGEFEMTDGKPFDFSLVADKGAVASELLVEKLNVKTGDKIRIGDLDFELRGVFKTEPGGVSGFRLGPRVFVEKRAFDEAGLTNFGSRNRRRILFRTSADPEILVSQLRPALKNAGSIATVRSYKEAQENTNKSFERAENYLSLTGLVILVLGGLGVWSVVRVFVEQKKQTIAVLKCLGASGAKITASYLLQILSLGLLGSLFGAALSQIALWLLERNFVSSLPEKMSYTLQPSALWQGIILGLSVSALFSLLPLLKIRRIKPRLLLRDQTGEGGRRFDFVNWAVGAFSVAGLLTLAIWQAGSWRVGLYFLLGLGATAGVLYATAFLLTRFLKIFRHAPSFALRQAIGSLSRPGNQTRVVLLAVGLGVFVVLAVQSLQSNLMREFDLTRSGSLPSLFLIDIRRAQIEPVKNLIAAETGETAEFIPAVRGRIAAVDGQAVDYEQREIRRQSGQIGREYVLTYRPTLVGDEEIVAGQFWDASPSSEPEISVDESLRGLLNLDLGSIVTFDISGQRINARVSSIRRLDARNPRSTFLIVFRPGALENAPQTFLVPVFAQLEAAERAALQRSLVNKFPNVSVIDTADVITAIKKLLNNIALAVSFLGLFVAFSGVLILIGSIALTKFQRVYENAILKTLGARRASLLAILLAEYLVLGLAAGIIGAAAANGLSYAVARYVLQIKWHFEPNLMLLGLLVTTLLVTLVGAISSLDVLLRKPLATLRSQ